MKFGIVGMDRAVAEAAAMCEEAGVVGILAGGLAMRCYGSKRFTEDIDLICDRCVDLPEFVIEGELSFGGQQFTTASGVPLDLIVRSDEYEELYMESITYARDIPGVPLKVVSPEYLMAMKMAAQRDKDDIDIAYLFTTKGLLDVPKARRIVKRFLGTYAVQVFDDTEKFSLWKAKEGKL